MTCLVKIPMEWKLARLSSSGFWTRRDLLHSLSAFCTFPNSDYHIAIVPSYSKLCTIVDVLAVAIHTCRTVIVHDGNQQTNADWSTSGTYTTHTNGASHTLSTSQFHNAFRVSSGQNTSQPRARVV